MGRIVPRLRRIGVGVQVLLGEDAAAAGGIEFDSGFDDVQIGQFANGADGLAQILGCGGHAEKPPVGYLDQGDWAAECTDAP